MAADPIIEVAGRSVVWSRGGVRRVTPYRSVALAKAAAAALRVGTPEPEPEPTQKPEPELEPEPVGIEVWVADNENEDEGRIRVTFDNNTTEEITVWRMIGDSDGIATVAPHRRINRFYPRRSGERYEFRANGPDGPILATSK